MIRAPRPPVRGAALLGLAVGCLGVLAGYVPWVAKMEDRAGIPWLFTLRGPRPPPPGITIVSIDERTGADLGLPADPEDWPRTTFASLVDALRRARARLIVLDLFFPERAPSADTEALATAMGRAGNVLITARLSKEVLAYSGGEGLRIGIELPAPSLVAAAAGVAPFPLPVSPVQISQFWTFHPGAGDWPTLPALVTQARAAAGGPALRRQIARLCPAAGPGIPPSPPVGAAAAETAREARGYVQGLPPGCRQSLQRFAGRMAPGDEAAVLAGLYAGPPARYLNYYGPPGQFGRIRFQDLLRQAPAGLLEGQVAFVGFAARDQVGQEDSFFSVFSDDTGLNLSGVEIAATATSNLLSGDSLRVAGPLAAAGLVLLWGLALGATCRLLPGALGIATGAVAALGWLITARWLFVSSATVIPVLVPIFLQVPLAIVAGLLLQFRHARVQRARIVTALGHYVPSQLVDRLAEQGVTAADAGENLFGTCMATDAAQYTRLAERLTPEEAGLTLNAYFDILIGAVEHHGGAVSDIVGDAMMAIWVSGRPDSGIERQSCHAAMRILAEIGMRAANGDKAALPTRIGLHSGIVRWGTVGARGHLQYRPVGDIVNTAARIESLNTRLGTRVLVSAETIAGVDDLRERAVGRFLFAGKSQPVTVHEILGLRGDGDPADAARMRLFLDALALFQAGDWARAWPMFRECEGGRPARDPVAAYYAALCAQCARTGPVAMVDGAVVVEGK